jgi:hypothetical protein
VSTGAGEGERARGVVEGGRDMAAERAVAARARADNGENKKTKMFFL